LERSAALLEHQYQAVLRHPAIDDEALARTHALTRRLSQQVRRQRLSAANSWSPEPAGEDEEWVNHFLGSKPRSTSLQDVVKQVQLEGRIVRRWQQQRRGDGFGSIGPQLDLGPTRVNVDSWLAVDVFRLERESQQPLTQVFMSIWSSRNLCALTKATVEQTGELARAIEASYRPNPYHNRMHAAEVISTAYYLWSQMASQEHMSGYFSDVDLLAVVFAAAVHDMAHPGTGNDYLVKTQHDLALRYCDRSVLENFHAASAFALVQDMQIPLLEHNLPSPPAHTLKGRIVDMILATDMAQHRRVLEDMVSEVAAHGAPQDIDKLVLEKHLLHFADIGHPLRPGAIHKEWSIRIREEFFAQGDAEMALGHSPAPLCDRAKAPTLSKSQVGFLGFVFIPAWRPVAQVIGLKASQPFEAYLAGNKAMWEDMAAAEEQDAQEPAMVAESLVALRPPASPCRRVWALKTNTSIF